MTRMTSRVDYEVRTDFVKGFLKLSLTFHPSSLSGYDKFKHTSGGGGTKTDDLVISDTSSNEDTSCPTNSTARQSEAQNVAAAASITIKDALDMLKYSFILQASIYQLFKMNHKKWFTLQHIYFLPPRD